MTDELRVVRGKVCHQAGAATHSKWVEIEVHLPMRKPVVILECDEDGNCGGLEKWMADWLRTQKTECIPERLNQRGGIVLLKVVLEEIATAIERILKEAQGD